MQSLQDRGSARDGGLEEIGDRIGDVVVVGRGGVNHVIEVRCGFDGLKIG